MRVPNLVLCMGYVRRTLNEIVLIVQPCSVYPQTAYLPAISHTGSSAPYSTQLDPMHNERIIVECSSDLSPDSPLRNKKKFGNNI